MIIRFNEIMVLLGSREGGKKAKNEISPILLQASPRNKLIFDFEGVSSISSSFADEFFGKLIADIGFERFKSITTFNNVSPFVASVIKNSIFHRNQQQFVNI